MEVTTNSTDQSLKMYDYINNFLLTPGVFIILLIIVVGYVIMFLTLGDKAGSASSNSSTFSLTGSSESSSNSGSYKILAYIMLGVLAVLVLINGVAYFFGVDIVASIKNLFTGNPQVAVVVDQSRLEAANSDVPSIIRQKQVFNIPGNTYGYNDAKSLCTAYGARLATYSEMEEAYDKGAEWCNYGWSDKQLALFPTQQATFDHLQTIKGHENDCGRPGVNGGFISNPHVQFGVNCFGYKPKITQDEQDLMASSSKYPKTLEDIAMEKRVDYWKNQLDQILVSPFNSNMWSKV